jgi:hypothetical protein
MTMLGMSTQDGRRRFLRGLGAAGVALMLDGGRSAAVASTARLRAPSDRRFAAVGQEWTVDAPLDPPVSVRSGLVGSVAEAGQLIALERGYFQEQGLSV